MKIGRNAPCPCGSSKKYKKCCLAKDEEARRVTETLAPSQPVPEPPPPAPPPPLPESPPPDPQTEAINARWEAFDDEDYEGRIGLFTTTLDEPELMDHEMTFHMLDKLYIATFEHDQRERFDTLVEALRTRLPEVYAEEAHYCLQWRISNALVTERFDALPSLVREIAATPDQDIDTFNRTIDQLAYYGQLPPLVDAMHLAWPKVQSSQDIVSWGIDEFSHQAMDFVIFDSCEHLAVPDPTDPTLIERLEFYHEIDPERLARYLSFLTGQAHKAWTMDDFTFQRRQSQPRNWFDEEDEEEPPPPDEARQHLFDLSVTFLGYLRREEGVPYTRGELARQQIYEYILDRFDKRLEPRENPLEAASRGRRKPRPKRKRHQPDHQLCPDHDTLDRHLGGLVNLLNFQWYKAGATLELVPAWLRFLESCQLIDAAQHAKTLQELHPLVTDLRKMWENRTEDPALLHGLQQGWAENLPHDADS
jgi:hypothetical protein